jgi:hypothetical protein
VSPANTTSGLKAGRWLAFDSSGKRGRMGPVVKYRRPANPAETLVVTSHFR